MSDRLLGAGAIEEYLVEVAETLSGWGDRHVVVLVGGALLAMHGLREATRDVDSVRRLDEELREAVAFVAQRHELAPSWLNDHAAGFVPATFNESDCAVLIDRPTLLVLGAPLDMVFLMKLSASRATDTPDLEKLWSRCTFASPEEAVEAFYRGYPHEESDPHLVDFIRNLHG